MKIARAGVVVLAVGWLSVVCAQGQTKLSSSDFVLPQMQLRTELTLDSAPPTPSPFPAHDLDTNSTREVSASTEETAGALTSYNVHGDRFYLEPGIEPAPESPLGQAFASIGDPEIVHLGSKPVACSLVTAIKRKNPLCLLNATFFKMTW